MNNKKQKLLSKSGYLRGLQCPKLLWVSVNEKERIPQPDPSTQKTLTQGQEVGLLAQNLFPGGAVLTTDFGPNLEATTEAMKSRKPIFEAGFLAERLYCRVDVLKPSGENVWDIVEVKSSTQVKEVNLNDVAFQRYVCQLAGVKINRCNIMHINNQYIRQGALDLNQLFTIEDVTDLLEDYSLEIRENVDSFLEGMDRLACTEEIIGRRCDSPYTCGLKDECWAFLPEQNVFTLTRGGELAESLLSRGIIDIINIPEGTKLNDKQRIQYDSAVCGKPHVRPAEIQRFLKNLKYPLYFMDFETFQTAVPLFDNSKPFQQIPFQFSVHVVRSPGNEPEHYEYLHSNTDDPRPRFLEELREVMGSEGSVLVYNQSFEQGRLKEAASVFSEHAGWIGNVCERMVDLIVPFRSFDFYHPDQCGSASLKQVMPALTGIGYDDLEINEGGLASVEYLEMVFGGDLNDEQRNKIRQNLLVYCGQDTGGMISIIKRLENLTDEMF